MINIKEHPGRHQEAIPAGTTVAFCRCWQSGRFPYCDGTHKKLNAETGDKVGPVVVTATVGEEAQQG